MVSRLIRRLAAIVPFAALVLGACEHNPAEPGSLASITVTRNPETLAISSTVQFTATGKDANGVVVGIVPVWSIAALGGTIDAASGVFTSGTVPGTFTNTVTATVGSISGTATAIVVAGPLATITLTPTPVTLGTGSAQLFTAVGRDAASNIIPITPNWSVAAGGGTISNTGLFTAGTTTGTFTNTAVASVGSISGRGTVTVIAGPLSSVTITPNPQSLAVGATQQFTATGRDANGNLVPITPVWSVVASGGTINPTGLFTAGTTSGTFTNTISAVSGATAGFATVTVTPGPLATITVAPNPVTLGLGATQQFTATGRDANANLISPLAFTWANANATAGSINATGLFTAGTTAGTFTNTVSATSGAITGTATVTVSAGGPATITVTPNPATLATGATQQFTAVVMDASGNILSTLPNWSVAVGGGTINSTGLFTAGTLAGTFTNTVTASIGAVSGTATVTVNPGPLSQVTVTPNPAILAIGATQQFTAVGRDANGNIVPFTETWSVQASGGTINATGLFTAGTAAGTFVNTVRACNTALCGVGSISGFATVTVNAGPLAIITVTPNPAAVGTDASQQFTAVGRDANNNIVPIVPAQTWSVRPGNAGGTILNPSGVYTAPTLAGSGIDTVRATSGAIFGSARVNVTASGALVSIAVTPNPANVGAGGIQQFTATGFDATGTIVPTPGLIWSIQPLQTAAGTINSGTGLFTAGITDGTFSNAVKAASGTISGFATVIVSTSLIDFGAAAPNGIMAGQAVTCISGGLISADVSVSPGNTITGFGPCVITGTLHLADGPALAAQNDLTSAYNTLQGLPCPPANAIVGDLGGTTIPAGVYCTASGIGVTGVVTLDGGGDPNANFVFQAGSSLVTAGDVVLINGAQARNVYWLSGSSVTLGTASQWKGNVVALTSITLVDTANLIGRALARNGSVTLGTGNTITLP